MRFPRIRWGHGLPLSCNFRSLAGAVVNFPTALGHSSSWKSAGLQSGSGIQAFIDLFLLVSVPELELCGDFS